MYNDAKINSQVLENIAITIRINTTNSLLTINSSYEMQTIEITNSATQLILKKSCNHKTEQLQLQNFSENICFVRVLYHNGISVTKKVIINNTEQ